MRYTKQLLRNASVVACGANIFNNELAEISLSDNDVSLIDLVKQFSYVVTL